MTTYMKKYHLGASDAFGIEDSIWGSQKFIKSDLVDYSVVDESEGFRFKPH